VAGGGSSLPAFLLVQVHFSLSESPRAVFVKAEVKTVRFETRSHYNHPMDNQQIARILRDTAQLLEIDGAIIGRYRSYEKAAELIASLHESVEQLAKEPEKLKELPGIGDRMVEHLDEILKTGDYSLRVRNC